MSPSSSQYEGRQKLTANWSVELPLPMAMRIEEGSLVFWHHPRRLTLWLTVAQGAPGAGGLVALDDLKDNINERAYDVIEDRVGGLLRFAYRLDEGSYNAEMPPLYGFAVAEHGEHVIFAAYFDHEDLLEPAMAAWRSIEWHGK